MEVRPGSMGKPAPGVDMAILGPKGVLAPGEEGEISVRTDLRAGKWIFQGYGQSVHFSARIGADGSCVIQ